MKAQEREAAGNEERGLADEQLIDKYRTGDRACMDALLERYRELVRHQARAFFLIGADQEDLIQEGMIGLFKAIRDFNGERGASFSSFAKLCILRQLYTAVQAANRQKHAPLRDYVELRQDMQEAPVEKSPEELLIAQEELFLRQHRLYRQLSKMEKLVLDYYLKGVPCVRIAEALNRTPKSIDNALQRIRKKAAAVKQEAPFWP